MHYEDIDNRPTRRSGHSSPTKAQRTPLNPGPSHRDVQSADHKRKSQHTPYSSPEKYRKSQSTGVARKEAKDDNKRKANISYHESLEKIRKTPQSGKFVNTLIGQWSKHMGMQIPLQPTATPERQIAEETAEKREIEGRVVHILQTKLKNAEQTISSLTNSHEEESRAKEEILAKLNANWESVEIITKYCNDISESLAGFQQHHANLSALYNNVITVQQSAVQKLQQDLSGMQAADEERKKLVSDAEIEMMNKEKRIEEIVTISEKLKERLEVTEKNLVLEKGRLESTHEEEKRKLIKEQEETKSENEKLQLKLKEIDEQLQNALKSFEQKDKYIKDLQVEISEHKKKIEDLLNQNAELTGKYVESARKEEESAKQLESKLEEVRRLRDNLNERQQIESDLAEDLDQMGKKYTNQYEQYTSLQSNFTSAENKLKEAQEQNEHLESCINRLKTENEQKITELNNKIDVLIKEKRNVVLDKQKRIQDVEGLQKSLESKHDKEVVALKKDFQLKLNDMKKTIDAQNTAFMKLNETATQINQENKSLRDKFQNMKERNDKLQSELNEKSETIAELKLKEMTKSCEATANVRDTERQSQHQQENRNSFTTKDYTEVLNVLSPIKQQKNVRFNLSPEIQASQHKENLPYLSQGKSLSQPQSQIDEYTLSVDSPEKPTRKFFKSRRAATKSNTSQQKQNKWK